jgi:Leucine-rich repeat (LRR) protein
MLQVLLDEASQTGELMLSGKNFNEFPAKLAAAYDLSDTITVDLSKNHLTEFPRELTHFDSLERLALQSNQIRLVCDITLYQLRCLRVLDLNSNSLAYLPPSVCNLSALQVLTVNNNKLVSLPEEIGALGKLIQLDVSCNEITHLPIQLGDLTTLRSLNVRRNLLVELPKGNAFFLSLFSLFN